MNIKHLRILTLSIVFLVVLIGGYLFYTQLRIKSRATAGIPTLSFATTPLISSTTGNFDLIVSVNPNNTNFNAFELHFKYDPAIVKFQNALQLNTNIVAISPLKTLPDLSKIDSATNTITVVGLKEGVPLGGAEDIPLVKVTLSLVPGAALPVLFTWDNATKLPSIATVEKKNGSFPESGDEDPGADPTKTGTVAFRSAKPGYIITENVNLDVIVSTGGQQVVASDIYLPFDSSKLDFQNVTFHSGTGFNNTTSVSATYPGGVRLTLLTPKNGNASTPVQGENIKAATIVFKTKAVGSVDFAEDMIKGNMYTPLNKNILGHAPQYTITINEEGVIPPAGSGDETNEEPPPETVKSGGDLLNINSTPIDRSPFRYEQQVVLDKGTYTLSAKALTYTARGRGVLVVLACAENNCGNGWKLNTTIGKTPLFPVSSVFVEQESAPIEISEEGKNKKYVVRAYVEDGSEADFDSISLINQWAGEQLLNERFAQMNMLAMPRKYPQLWEIDIAGKLYGTVDPDKGTGGALYINSISRK